ncbi:MAG: hypothetical protein LBQ52_01855 [Helicobacteraceae bacterium]|jgi:archaellum component FlaC|nr:hypothetical protein [Helicobacteraceae bacterium]
MNQARKWNNNLKAAIINEEIETIARLYGDLPNEFDDLSDAQESAALIAESIKLLRNKRERLQTEIDQTKKAIAYHSSQVGLRVKSYEVVS